MELHYKELVNIVDEAQKIVCEETKRKAIAAFELILMKLDLRHEKEILITEFKDLLNIK